LIKRKTFKAEPGSTASYVLFFHLLAQSSPDSARYFIKQYATSREWVLALFSVTRLKWANQSEQK